MNCEYESIFVSCTSLDSNANIVSLCCRQFAVLRGVIKKQTPVFHLTGFSVHDNKRLCVQHGFCERTPLNTDSVTKNEFVLLVRRNMPVLGYESTKSFPHLVELRVISGLESTRRFCMPYSKASCKLDDQFWHCFCLSLHDYITLLTCYL